MSKIDWSGYVKKHW